MSQISKALKKVQDLRNNFSKPKDEMDPVHPAEAPKPVPPSGIVPPSANGMLLLTAGIAVSLLISILAIMLATKNVESKRIQTLSFEKTIKAQEKRINDLINIINRNNAQNALTVSQVQDLKLRVRNEIIDINVQLGHLDSNMKDNYSHLKEAILNDQEEMDLLDKYTKSLNEKIEAVSNAQAASNSQATSNPPSDSNSNNQLKDVPSPLIGN